MQRGVFEAGVSLFNDMMFDHLNIPNNMRGCTATYDKTFILDNNIETIIVRQNAGTSADNI